MAVQPKIKRFFLEATRILAEWGEKLPWYVSWLFVFFKEGANKKLLRSYCEYLAKHTSRIDLPFKVEGTGISLVRMDQLFVDVVLEVESSARQEVNIEEKYLDHRRRLSYSHEFDRGVRDGPDPITGELKKRNLVTEMIGKGEKIIIIGNPGSGKTTVLKKLVGIYSAAYSENSTKAAFLPVLITCRELPAINKEESFMDLLRSQFRRVQRDTASADKLLVHFLAVAKEGRGIVFVDGLDEIATLEDRTEFCRKIVAFSDANPDCAMVLTSRIIGFRRVEAVFDEGFARLMTSDLSKEQKLGYLAKWSDLFDTTKGGAPVYRNDLEHIVCHSRGTARLTENILMLSIITQLYYKHRSLPERRVDIYRAVIVELLERRQEHIPYTNRPDVNEVLPQLEYVAYQMKRDLIQLIPDDKLAGLIQKGREQMKRPEEIFRRPPKELIGVLDNHMGIINVAGKQEDEQGIEREIYQFSHQSFQEYLAGQAILHAWVEGEHGSSQPEKLRTILANAQLLEVPIQNLKWRQATEVVLAETWQETIRSYIANLDEKDAEACIDLILSANFLNPGKKLQRACAIFAAQCLVEEPKVSWDIVGKVLDSILDNLIELDGIDSKRNTSMDELVYTLARSKWKTLLEEKLFRQLDVTRDDIQRLTGCVVVFFLNYSSQTIEKGESHSYEFIPVFASGDTNNILRHLFKVLEFCYQANNNFLDADLKELLLVKKELFRLMEESQPVTYAALWTLSWMTTAKVFDEKPKLISLEPKEFEYLLSLSKRTRDNNVWVYIAYLLSQKDAGIYKDWIYDFAVVADGAASWDSLRFPRQANDDPFISELLWVLQEGGIPAVKKAAALALGRLNYFPRIAQDVLWNILLDGSLQDDMRSEAALYLSFSREEGINEKFYELMLQHYEDANDLVASRCFLCSIAIGDWRIMEKMLSNRLIPNKSGLHDKGPAAFVLACQNTPDARRILKDVMQGDDEGAKVAVRKALSKEWAKVKM